MIIHPPKVHLIGSQKELDSKDIWPNDLVAFRGNVKEQFIRTSLVSSNKWEDNYKKYNGYNGYNVR